MNSAPCHSMTCEELAELLDERGIDSAVVENFKEEKICGEALPLTHEELEQLAPKIGSRKQLIKRVPELTDSGDVPVQLLAPTSSPVSHTSSSDTSTVSSDLPADSAQLELSPVTDAEMELSEEAYSTGIKFPAPLPSFSKVVSRALQQDAYQEWDQLLRECAVFYLPDLPEEEGRARQSYHNIGRTMYEAFPSIKSTGQNAWSHFNRCLSSKVRWERRVRKKKSGGQSRQRATGPLKGAKVKKTALPSVLDEESFTDHLVQLKAETCKGNKKDVNHVKRLLKETYTKRQMIVRGGHLSTEEVFDRLWEDYPCFEEEMFVAFEFSQVFPSAPDYEKNYKAIVPLLMKFFDVTTELEVWKLAECRFPQKKKSVSFLEVIEIERAQETLKKQCGAPALFVFTDDGEPTSAFVKAYNKVRVEIVGEKIIQRGLFLLLAVYYITGSAYPACFNLILTFLQAYVLQDSVLNPPRTVVSLAGKIGMFT